MLNCASQEPVYRKQMKLSRFYFKPSFGAKLFRKTHLVAISLSAMILLSALAIVPLSRAQPQVYKGPALSGVFAAELSFTNDSPGLGAITKSTCTDGTDLGGGNFRINCDSTALPHNEMTIAVDPTDPNHLLAGSNDYELFRQGNRVIERIIAGYYTSFDGGTTWLNGHVPLGDFGFSGDPAVAFNRRFGVAHFGVLANNGGQAFRNSPAVSVQVNTSHDGGKTFDQPVLVALGTGNFRNVIFNDKPYITVDNSPSSPFYGRLYVTWTRFVFDNQGRYVESPIFSSFSSDGGHSFSTPASISGSSITLCAKSFNSFNSGMCNEDQFSSPTVGPDGTLYVAFENGELQGAPEFRDQYLVVRSTDGGQTFQGPFQAIGPLIDGVDDYAINVDGRQTLTNSQFRVNSAGNLEADLSSGAFPNTRLYISFSDNRNGHLTGSFSTVTTNTDVFVVRSDNSGNSWTGALPVLSGTSSLNDQFYPWAAVDSTGTLKVAFSDRNYDSANVKYGETLVSSTNHGVAFSARRVDTGLSNPNDSRFFTNGGTTNGKATFLGDYNGLDIGPNGVAHPIWTDMRVAAFPSPPPGRGHNTQDAVTASV